MTRRTTTTMRPTLYFVGSFYPTPKNFRFVSQPLPNPIPRRKTEAARTPQPRPLEYDPLPDNGHFDPLVAEVGYNGAWVTPAHPNLPQLWRRELSKGAGLVNLGNTCFMNAVIQVLLFCPPAAALLAGRRPHCAPSPSSVEKCVLCALQRLAVAMLRRPGSAIAPYALKSLVRDVCHDFRAGEQEDAQEFMRGLLDAVTAAEMAGCGALKHGVNLTREVEAGSSVHRLFGGMLQSCVRCVACGHRSTRLEPFLDLSLETTRCNDVASALRKFTAPERLDGEKPYRCAGCNGMVNANKRLTIRRAPNVLVLHLKRFDSTGNKTKGFVRYPEVLSLGQFMPGRPDSPEPRYRLCSVLVHAGTASAGHYYAFVHSSDGRWYCKDDNQTYLVPGEKVMGQKAYILTYTRLPEPIAAPPKPRSESPSMNKKMPDFPSAKGFRPAATTCVPVSESAASLEPALASAPAPAPMNLGAIVAMYTAGPHSHADSGSEITPSDNRSERDESSASSKESSRSKASGRVRSILIRSSSAVRKVVNKVFGVEKQRQSTSPNSSSQVEEATGNAEPVTSSSVTEPTVKGSEGDVWQKPKGGSNSYREWILLKRKRYHDDEDERHERKKRNRGCGRSSGPRAKYQSPFAYFTERRWRRRGILDSFEFVTRFPDR